MVEILLAFVGSICPGILYNVNRKILLWVGLSGMIGWISYSRIYDFTDDITLSTFVGSIIVGLYSESLARIIKAPAIVFSVPGIFPLVPGIAVYTTMQFIVKNRLNDAASKGIEAITSAGAIAFGILLVSALFRIFSKGKKISPDIYNR